jgi:tyrosyl-tRNA synthetase
MGRDVQGSFGQPEQVILTMPILPGTDGEKKMSKSVGNHVGVTEAPEEIYGKTMSIPDTALESWYGLLLGSTVPADDPYAAKRALARTLVERFHGADAADAAEAHFERVFREREMPEEIQEATFAAANGVVHLPELISELFGGSRSEARRTLAQGGVKVDGEPLPGDVLDVPAEQLDGAVLQVGKRRFRRLRLER